MMTVDFNSSKLGADIRQYARLARLELSDAINKKMLYVARGAWKATPQVTREQVQSALARASRVNPRIPVSRLLAVLKVRKHSQSKGTQAPTRAEVDKAESDLIRRRRNAAGSLKAGWIRCIKTILASTKGEPSASFAVAKVRHGGRATAAASAQGENPFALITYDLAIKLRRGGKAIDPRVTAALKASFDREAQSTEDYITRKLAGLKK